MVDPVPGKAEFLWPISDPRFPTHLNGNQTKAFSSLTSNFSSQDGFILLNIPPFTVPKKLIAKTSCPHQHPDHKLQLLSYTKGKLGIVQTWPQAVAISPNMPYS